MATSRRRNIMAKAKKSLVSAKIEGNLVKATIQVTDALIRTGLDKNAQGANVSYKLVIENPLNDVLMLAADSLIIKVASIRKKGIDAIKGLNGQTIKMSDIASMVAGGETLETKIDKMSLEDIEKYIKLLEAKKGKVVPPPAEEPEDEEGEDGEEE
jgi:hypothetical protein